VFPFSSASIPNVFSGHLVDMLGGSNHPCICPSAVSDLLFPISYISEEDFTNEDSLRFAMG